MMYSFPRVNYMVREHGVLLFTVTVFFSVYLSVYLTDVLRLSVSERRVKRTRVFDNKII